MKGTSFFLLSLILITHVVHQKRFVQERYGQIQTKTRLMHTEEESYITMEPTIGMVNIKMTQLTMHLV